MISAGHCGATGAKFNHGGVTIGTNGVARNAMDPANFDGFDLERTFSNGTYYPTTQNIIYATDSYKSWTLTSVMSQANLVVGVRAAKSGVTTGYTNGYVLNATVFYKLIPARGQGSLVMYPTCTYENQGPCPIVQGVLTDAASAGGDSGAPFFTWLPTSPPMQHVFLGILSAGSSSRPSLPRRGPALSLQSLISTTGARRALAARSRTRRGRRRAGAINGRSQTPSFRRLLKGSRSA